MSHFIETNNSLSEAVKQIEIVTHDLNVANENYLKLDAQYENDFSRYLLETKLKNPDMTGPEIKAMAITLSYGVRLEMIKAESNYRRLQNELKIMRDKLDIYREISFNLRAEAKTR